MASLANDHNIDPATNPAFAAKLVEHYNFLGIDPTSEAIDMIERDGDWSNMHELSDLQLQKVRWALRLIDVRFNTR